MITTKESTTNIQFGTNGKGSVSLAARRGTLTIQQLLTELNIGDRPDLDRDVQELPKVVLNFNEVASVEAMIRTLEKVKQFMQEPDPMQLCYAC